MMNKTRFDSKEEAENFHTHCGYPATIKYEEDVYGYNWVVEETQASLRSRYTPKV